MSQLAQLSEAEIEERYYLTGGTAIAFTLAGFAEHKESFSVQFAGGSEHFLTILLGVQPEAGCLIIDCSGSVEINRRFPESLRNVFVARPGGIHVQFTTGQAREITFRGARAFAVPLPKFIVRLQRREVFRIETPLARPLQFHARLAGGHWLTLPAHDISVAGVGLSAGNHANLEAGIALANCRFALPAERHEILVQAVVRHVTALELRAGVTQWRVGLQFVDLRRADDKQLQRYIVQVEHQRHELS
ncbi:flagellar brake protein [Accumulibacter sp.]|uniref:flagellar brake protein n=1 Tax=Accumulibacter sp. TaxID=2053492 RepID=UPI002604D1D5|nr:flagellar brake protein [Accumulibacter sp.]